MKKSLLALMIVAGVNAATAQTKPATPDQETPVFKNKKGEVYLPEAGDWAIGFDASSFISYAGNLLNGNTWNSMSMSYVGNYTPVAGILGKYYKDAKTAYRGRINITTGVTTTKNFVTKDQTIPDPTVTVEDSKKTSSTTVLLGGGIEKRKGKTRLQGYYGAEAYITLSGGSKTTYEYGNAMSTTVNGATSTTNWGTKASSVVTSRTIESKTGGTFGIGAAGFIGAEYFILPKLSLGAEYHWGLYLSTTGKGKSVTETWNGTSAKTTESEIAGGSSFGLKPNASYGNIYILFHF